jgi:CBS domain containing-hemolysin-like protein
MDLKLYDIYYFWEVLKNFMAVDSARLMQTDMIVRLGLQMLLLVGSAFFSGSETAMFSLSRLDLQKLRTERNRHSETIHALLDQPRRLIISILCGNELINVAAAANMTGILVRLYGGDRAGLISTLIMVPLLLLIGEVTPKIIAVSNPVRISTGVVAAPLSVWVKVITPLRWAIRGIADRITTMIVGEEKTAENILQIDEFRSLVEEVADKGELDATERALIYNLLEANDTEIVEIMTPRTRICFIDEALSVPEMVERFRAYRHPRVPVFRKHHDNIVGFFHAEDLLRLILDDADLSTLKPEDIMHPPVVVPLTKKVDEMFDFFQANKARAAVVLNEFGGVEGLVTMRGVLNFIFGQVSGEVTGQELYHERDENNYEVPGDMKLTDFNNLTNFGIEDPRMTTIGGVAFRHLDRLPRPGDKVTVEDIIITVLEMDEHRITKVRVSRGILEEEDAEGKDLFQELDEGIIMEDRNFPVDRFEPAGESKNSQPDAAEQKIASESEERM